MSRLIHRISGPVEGPVAVYLPGVHGDWTPLETARPTLTQHVRLVEVEYPKEAGWNLPRYAQSVRHLLDSLNVEKPHIVGESFGSLVAWEYALQETGGIQSLILVGGFTSTPGVFKTLVAKTGLSLVPTRLFEKVVDVYSESRGRRKAGVKHGEVLAPYSAVRTPEGRKATIGRFGLVQHADYTRDLHRVTFPVRYIGGEKDRVVPVAREISVLREALPETSGFESRVISGGPHMIVSSHPEETASTIGGWVSQLSKKE